MKDIQTEENLFNSKHYWIKRYEDGGNSGEGSYNKFAEFKSSIINPYLQKVHSVLDLGCGDGNQLSYFTLPSVYYGYDISPKAIRLCREKFPELKFSTKLPKNKKYDLVLSLDVIFHLIEDTVYEEYISQLFYFSNKYVIIYANPKEIKGFQTAEHVKFRNNEKFIAENYKNWRKIDHVKNKYPLKNGRGSPSEFMIYEVL